MSAGEKIRVVTLCDQLGLAGGGERLARNLTVALDPDRFERVFCVSRYPEEEIAAPGGPEAVEELRRSGVELLMLPRRSRFDLRSWRPLVDRIRAGRVDVLHSHKLGSNAWAAGWSLFARPPVLIAHEHTWSFEGKPVRKLIDRELIARRADAFCCVSLQDRDRMIEIERIDPAKLVYIPNGIPPLEVVDRPGLRAELELPDGVPVVGAVTVLRDQKAVDVLLRACAIVRERFADVHVLVAGDGPERGRLERLRDELGLSATVRFLGNRADVPSLLGLFDVATLSSDYEGAPLALIEYMAAGLPIVATRVGGVPDMVEDGVSALLVERRSPEQLAAAVIRLLTDRAAAAELGAAARRRQHEEFSLATAARRVAELYERLYAAASRGDSG
jgi:glycosyltransferase involved in cell wall biosynthesis